MVHRRDLVTGALIPMTPMEMPWFLSISLNVIDNVHAGLKRSIAADSGFLTLSFGSLLIIKTEGPGYFDRWMVCETDCFGKKSSPIELLLLRTLRYGIMHYHSAFKFSGTARTYNLTVNHHLRILHTTSGH